jgi:hypothetical protein
VTRLTSCSSISGNASQETARETTVEGSAAEETTVAPTTVSEEREEPEEDSEEQAQQESLRPRLVRAGGHHYPRSGRRLDRGLTPPWTG